MNNRRILSCLGQNLDARIDGSKCVRIVLGLFPVEIHSRSARRFGIRRHCQILSADGRKLRTCHQWTESDGRQKNEWKRGKKTHECLQELSISRTAHIRKGFSQSQHDEFYRIHESPVSEAPTMGTRRSYSTAT